MTRAQAGHPQAGVGIVRPLHARRHVDQIPSLRHRGDQPVHGDGDQLGMGTGPAVDEPEHPVPDGVRPDALAYVDHDSGVLRPQHLDSGPWPPTEGPVDPGAAGPVRTVGAVHGGCVQPDQDLAATGYRLGDVVEANDLRAAVPRPDRCTHGSSMIRRPDPTPTLPGHPRERLTA